MNIRNVTIGDLKQVMAIENICFSKDEAASEKAMKRRIEMTSDTFLVAEENEKIAGIINGPVINSKYITDDLFKEVKRNPSSGGHQSILGLAVSPSFQNRGLATALLTHLEKIAKVHNRETLTLTCKKKLIHFYERQGFRNGGISNSKLGGVTWYNMVKEINR